MFSRWSALAVALGSVCVTVGSLAAPPPASSSAQDICPQPALSRVTRHTVKAGETLEAIAQRYNLIPATLMGFNPSVRNGKVTPGSELLIPPYNGIRVEVPAGQTWRDLAAIYRVRPDVLFEVNGCQTTPKVVFVPGVNWSPVNSQQPGSNTKPNTPTSNNFALVDYPLPSKASVILAYGWRLQPALGQVAFHGGVDLAAPIGTKVLAVGDGTVAFADEQGAYGKLVVINHAGGRQTRYAHLGAIAVKVGQTIKRGTVLGSVGKTGQPSSAAPHLHFEVRSNSNLGWVADDPEPYLQNMKVAKQ